MPASTSTPIATSRPRFTMNPTITEHDWRFPRRPDKYTPQHHHPAHRKPGAVGPGYGAANGDDQQTFREMNADVNRTYSTAKNGLLNPSLFPSLPDSAIEASQSLERMREEDPLATQIWKFFTKTKQQLPNQQRMENLTWRMMALSMRKKQQQEEERKQNNNRYVPPALFICDCPPPGFDSSIRRHDVLTWASSQACPAHDAKYPQWHSSTAQILGALLCPARAHESRRLHFCRQCGDTNHTGFSSSLPSQIRRRQVRSLHGLFRYPHQIPQGTVAPLRPPIRSSSSPEQPERVQLCPASSAQD